MVEVVYVNEYQPSSATLRIAGDPIYSQSVKAERIRVGAPPSLMILPILAALAWIIMQSEQR